MDDDSATNLPDAIKSLSAELEEADCLPAEPRTKEQWIRYHEAIADMLERMSWLCGVIAMTDDSSPLSDPTCFLAQTLGIELRTIAKRHRRIASAAEMSR